MIYSLMTLAVEYNTLFFTGLRKVLQSRHMWIGCSKQSFINAKNSVRTTRSKENIHHRHRQLDREFTSTRSNLSIPN